MLDKAFKDEVLEQAYQAALRKEKLRHGRVLILMALAMNLAFIPLDLWAIPSALTETWLIRLAISAIAIGIYIRTWLPGFTEQYTPWLVTLFLTMGSGINGMILVTDPADFAADAYYGGLILVTFGIYTLSYIRLRIAILISLTLIASYIAVAVFEHNYLTPEKFVVLLTNLYFFVGATVIGVVAKGIRDQYSMENYLLRQSLERDIELSEEEKQRAAYLAEHDALTGLPNRRNFQRQARELLRRAAARGETAALLFIDLDNFKPVNDNHGHETGDRALKIIGRRLQKTIRAEDAIARFGGDEFLVCLILNNGVEAVLGKLMEAVAEPIEVRGAVLHLSASIGVALYPEQGDSLDQLIRAADQDMYRQKSRTQRQAVAR